MKPNEATGNQEIMHRLKNAGELYVLLSLCTGEPYVVCHQETYDDEIIVFFDSQAAIKEAKRTDRSRKACQAHEAGEQAVSALLYQPLHTWGKMRCWLKTAGETP